MRRILFAGVVALGLYLFVEMLSFAAFRIIYGEMFSFAPLARERITRQTIEPVADRDAATVWHEDRRGRFIPHPYMGAIHQPSERAGDLWWIPNLNEGSLDDAAIVNVVATGGSFAHFLAADGAVLADELEKIDAFRGKRLQLINLAFVGNKQPQQLMAVNYLLALGARIDLLINLDGFNEVGSELHANVKYGVFPAYPWTWVPLTKGLRSEGELRGLGNIYAYRQIRAVLARWMAPLGFSVTGNLVWRSLDKLLERAEFRAIGDQVPSNSLPVFSRGPRFRGSDEEAFELGVDLWANSSLSLQHLADGRGFPYFHFLQPNQYVDGSKPFTARENRLLRSNPLFRELIPRWYPALMERGASLREQGVAFYDLTGVYRDVEKEVYFDDCCHVDHDGNQIIAREIGRILAQHYSGEARWRAPMEAVEAVEARN